MTHHPSPGREWDWQEALAPTVPASTFFEWASLSPICRTAAVAVTERQAHLAGALDAPKVIREVTFALDGIRGVIGRMVNRGERRSVLGRSVAEFMSLLAAGLPTDTNQKVVLAGPVHPAVILAWRGTDQPGSTPHSTDRVVSLYPTPDHRVDLAALAGALAAGDCAVVVISHVDHLHGTEHPVAEIARLAHAAGAIVVVDGAQAVGRIPVNLENLDVDIYMAAGRKALLASLGTAFMVAHPILLATISPLVWSTRSARLDDGQIRPATSPTHLEGNLPDLAALAGLGASVHTFIDPAVVATVQERVQILGPRIEAGFADLGFHLGSPDTAHGNRGIWTFRTPAHIDGTDVQHHLRSVGIIVAAEPDTVRVSVHLANNEDAVSQLLEETKRHGH